MEFKNALIYTEAFRFEPGGFAVENGRFVNVLGKTGPHATDLGGARVLPGLIDIHTHGNSGADFSDGDYEGLVRMARYYAANGVTSFAPTSLTLPFEELARAYGNVCRLDEEAPAGCAAARGIHMEGPFFCAARKGAQNAAYLREPDAAAFRALNAGCGGRIRIVDLAPELPHGLEFIRAVRKDCAVSIAHTDADYDTAKAAIDAGVTHLTHLFNAMPSLHHRRPGPIAAAAEDERVSAEIISDGLHVHSAMVKLAFQLFGAGRMVLVSDSLRCCGMPDGEYDLAGLHAFLQGGVARLADGTLAGSATNVYDCMRRAVSFGVPLEDAIRAATYNPARELGCLDQVGSIADGKRADFVVCTEKLDRLAVYLAGEKL